MFISVFKNIKKFKKVEKYQKLVVSLFFEFLSNFDEIILFPYEKTEKLLILWLFTAPTSENSSFKNADFGWRALLIKITTVQKWWK